MSKNITVIIPTKNEELNITQCLNALKSWPYVIVVDSCSDDRTADIVNSFDRDIIAFNWNGSYPKKRNWVLDNIKVTTDWVLFLDADEIIPNSFSYEFEKKIAADPNISAFWLNYRQYYMNVELLFGERQRKLALFKHENTRYERVEADNDVYDMEIHEHPIISGKVSQLKTRIKHNDFKSVQNSIEKHCNYAAWEVKRYHDLNASCHKKLTARQKIKYLFLRYRLLSEFYFIYIYFVRFGFLDGHAGLCYARLKREYFLNIYKDLK